MCDSMVLCDGDGEADGGRGGGVGGGGDEVVENEGFGRGGVVGGGRVGEVGE